MLLFDTSACVPIRLENQSPYVRLAAQDLARDLARASKGGISPRLIDKEEPWCIVIEKNDPRIEDPIEDESFRILVRGQKIRICAPTYLGTMWGIYTVSKKFLGIDPCYLFHDLPLEKKERSEIEDTEIFESGSDFGFRGAFINDEDLLTGWRDGGGRRYMDYPWYSTTVSPDAMDAVVETLLRLRINLVIPASFLDIDNPPEKMLADCVARRGIYVSQHHLEPLGLSHFTLENYCKRYKKVGEYSYLHSKELLEEAWRYYAEKWSRYENVVWQLGLRGKADRPVWEEAIPSERELCSYGSFISEATERQRQIVLEKTGGRARHFTSTLWMEGSSLMEKGYLTVSDDVCLVFSDNGPNQMFGNEYLGTKRREGGRYGIYYHLQYFNIGPHLAPQTGIEKIRYNITKAYNAGDRAYCILNVSNLREFTLELSAAAGMLWSVKSEKDYIASYCKRAYGGHAKEAETLIGRYFDLSPVLPTELLCNVHAKYFNYNYKEKAKGIKNFVLKDGLILSFGGEIIDSFHERLENSFYEKIYEQLLIAEQGYARLCENFEAFIGGLDIARAQHARATFALYAKTLESFYLWYVRLYEAKIAHDKNEGEKAKEKLFFACAALQNYLEIRKCAEYGIFKNWYREETKLNVKERLSATRALLAGITAD